MLHDNAALNETWNRFEAPIIQWSTIESNGYGEYATNLPRDFTETHPSCTELNAMEMRPPRMDDSGRTKYPVLFRVYGGPGSQMVNVGFNRDWHHYLAASLEYIIVTVDGRGTGFKGRQLRNPVSRNLGYWETVDQIEAAR